MLLDRQLGIGDQSPRADTTDEVPAELGDRSTIGVDTPRRLR